MISIRRFLDRPPEEACEPEKLAGAVSHLRSLIQEGIEARSQLDSGLTTAEFRWSIRDLGQRLDETQTALQLAILTGQTMETFEGHTRGAIEYFREQGAHMHSMVSMLTKTVADLSGQTDDSVARLQAVERQIERASALNDIRALKSSLAVCLEAVKETAVRQKTVTLATVERLHEYIRSAPQLPVPVRENDPPKPDASTPAEYLAAFRLQRAEHVAGRFGAATLEQMLSAVAEGLKTALSPNDRLMRWKGNSFVMFLSSSENIAVIRRRLSAAVAKLGQRYVEAGKNAALLAIAVDWVLFSQSQYPSLDAVFVEVDSFLTGRS